MTKITFKDEQEEKDFDDTFNDDVVEVARSCSRKVNLGNYETIDYFCSRKEEVVISKVTEKSAELAEWCKQEVMKDVDKHTPVKPPEPAVKWIGEPGSKQPVAKSDAEDIIKAEINFNEENANQVL